MIGFIVFLLLVACCAAAASAEGKPLTKPRLKPWSVAPPKPEPFAIFGLDADVEYLENEPFGGR